MPTQLTVAQHLEALRTAMLAFVRYADRAGLAAPVPTCAEWTVLDLVVHQGVAHRWARALLRREPVHERGWEQEGAAAPDPLQWLRDGVIDLVGTVSRSPADLRAVVFLEDAPAPLAFWARRQCHETTLHAADALGAALGRCPVPEETWIETAVAVDGIDELLGGFLTRSTSRLRTQDEQTLVVAPDDVADWWEVSLGPRPAVTTRRTGRIGGRTGAGDYELTGSAVGLYLRLWNRQTDDFWGSPESMGGGVPAGPRLSARS